MIIHYLYHGAVEFSHASTYNLHRDAPYKQRCVNVDTVSFSQHSWKESPVSEKTVRVRKFSATGKSSGERTLSLYRCLTSAITGTRSLCGRSIPIKCNNKWIKSTMCYVSLQNERNTTSGHDITWRVLTQTRGKPAVILKNPNIAEFAGFRRHFSLIFTQREQFVSFPCTYQMEA